VHLKSAPVIVGAAVTLHYYNLSYKTHK